MFNSRLSQITKRSQIQKDEMNLSNKLRYKYDSFKKGLTFIFKNYRKQKITKKLRYYLYYGEDVDTV